MEKGVSKMVVVGYDIETSLKAIEIASCFDFVYAAVGIHPSEVKSAKISDLEVIEELLKKEKVVSVGEIGLDYHWDKDNKEAQKEYFVKQIVLANKYNKPIIIHSRDAAEDTYDALREYKQYYKKGIMHCYSYSLEMAKKFIELNLKIAFGGSITFLNAKENKRVVENINIENIVIETDAPYLTPHPFRGKINEPKYIELVAKKISEIKNISMEKVARETYNNACDLFGVEK
jgi:TatD DNase family protein